jgi:hypothetical protein
MFVRLASLAIELPVWAEGEEDWCRQNMVVMVLYRVFALLLLFAILVLPIQQCDRLIPSSHRRDLRMRKNPKFENVRVASESIESIERFE